MGKSHIEISFEIAQAQSQGEFIKLRDDAHRERHGCILSEKWYELFSNQARALVADQEALEAEIDHKKLELKRLQLRLKALQSDGNRMAVQLLSKPPQGQFFFTGEMFVIRSTMHCVLVDPSDGEPILETYRKLTDTERAEFSKLDEAMREEAIAARQTTINDFIKKPAKAEEAPDESADEASEVVEDEDPFGAPDKNRLN